MSERDPSDFVIPGVIGIGLCFAAISSFSPALALLFLGLVVVAAILYPVFDIYLIRRKIRNIGKQTPLVWPANTDSRPLEPPKKKLDAAAIRKKLEPLVIWHQEFEDACSERIRQHGWLSKSFATESESAKPKMPKLRRGAIVSLPAFSALPPEMRNAFKAWRDKAEHICEQKNASFARKELVNQKAFFDSIEASPLTKEQAQAVLCFDGRVRVIASAGSGKTSTLVAKAAYAIKRGYFKPQEILVLAFNRDAADEIGERIRQRFLAQGVQADGLSAQTFHAFGLRVLGEATNQKPSVAPWVDRGREIAEMQDIVDEIKAGDPSFRENWDLFKWVFPQDISKPDDQNKVYDSWDPASKSGTFWTLKGENVKSEGERFVANLLFFYGINYEYERPYEIKTADRSHSQYRPDFYFPELDAYLEHWAVDANGKVPESFRGYAESMVWKKKLHEMHETTLLETSYGDFQTGRLSDRLRAQLVALGADLDYDPERQVPGRQPITDSRLLTTMRVFMSHAKGNHLSITSIRNRIAEGVGGSFRERKERFIDLFEIVWNRWERRLDDGGFVDFDDMLSRAADAVEAGEWRNPYRLILVDEFQDTSQARARLLKKLIKKPNSVLFTVGDDWQSVNRFAGSDLTLMAEFETHFGAGTTLEIGTTFRCPQPLCDISSGFIQKNPSQIQKTVKSATKRALKNPVSIVRTKDAGEIATLVRQRLEEINYQAPVQQGISVLMLGRYNQDRKYLPRASDLKNIRGQFKTVHASKGMQADHVILLNVVSGAFGFPSRIEDDPILQIAMPGSDDFPFSEERRLFYVALTRAKQTVTIITLAGQESEFLVELVRDHGLKMADKTGEITAENTCPKCKKGILVEKTGRHGEFFSCSRFPSCEYSRSA